MCGSGGKPAAGNSLYLCVACCLPLSLHIVQSIAPCPALSGRVCTAKANVTSSGCGTGTLVHTDQCTYMYMYSSLNIPEPFHYVHVQCIVVIVHVHALGYCIKSRPKGRLRPRELWFSIYSCVIP